MKQEGLKIGRNALNIIRKTNQLLGEELELVIVLFLI